MTTAIEEKKNSYSYAFPMPSVTVDLIIFTIIKGTLCFLTIERKHPPHRGSRALPGGFLEVDRGETLEEAAAREAFEETNLKNLFIEQLYTFGDPNRDPRGRVITVAYYCLVPAGVKPRAGDDAKNAEWTPVRHLSKSDMAFDHHKIVNMAVERLKGKIAYTTIAYQLLPKRFTMSELQSVYEIILGYALDQRNFRRYVADRGLVIPTEERRVGKHRPAKLYRFNQKMANSQLAGLTSKA